MRKQLIDRFVTCTNADRSNKIIDDGKPAWLSVNSVEYVGNNSFGGPSTVKAVYNCEGRKVTEYICIEHKGFAKHKADHWVKFRGGEKCNSVDELMARSSMLTTPSEICVQKKGKHYVVSDAKFEEVEQPSAPADWTIPIPHRSPVSRPGPECQPGRAGKHKSLTQ